MLLNRYGISKDTVTIIGEFSILWCRLEQVYFNTSASHSKIEAFAMQLQVDDELLELYKSLKVASINYLGCVNPSVVTERIYSKENEGSTTTREHICSFLNGDESKPDWVGCLLYIQRIRNNLFHGLKDIYSLDEQSVMFSSICQLLNCILQKDYY